jgi:hypothetical protein
VRSYRALGSLRRQRAVFNTDNSWKWLSEAERWETWPTLSTPVTRNALGRKDGPRSNLSDRGAKAREFSLNLLIHPTHPLRPGECPAGTQGEPSLVRPVQLTRSLEMFASDFMNRVSCLSKICFPHGGSKPFSRKNPADGRRNSTQT